jgi:hypothetical protein
MPTILRRLSPVSLLAATLCAAAGQGYLPVVGPPPVRFEKPVPAPTEPPLVLPPLTVIEPRPAVLPTDPAPTPLQPGPLALSEPANPIVDLTPLDPVVSPVGPALVMDPLATNAPPVDTSILAPQMFMRYFTGQPGTNGNGISIFAPVGFVPPLPVPPAPPEPAVPVVPPSPPDEDEDEVVSGEPPVPVEVESEVAAVTPEAHPKAAGSASASSQRALIPPADRTARLPSRDAARRPRPRFISAPSPGSPPRDPRSRSRPT